MCIGFGAAEGGFARGCVSYRYGSLSASLMNAASTAENVAIRFLTGTLLDLCNYAPE
jgi:hypothetical protein